MEIKQTLIRILLLCTCIAAVLASSPAAGADYRPPICYLGHAGPSRGSHSSCVWPASSSVPRMGRTAS